MRTSLFARLTLALLFLITFTYAQVVAIEVKVPFQFKVADKVLPAGQYRITEEEATTPMLRIENTTVPTAVAFEAILTRLAMQGANTASVVFDKVEDTYTLSEVWIPGTDGYLVHTTPGKHQHHVIRSER